MHYGLRDSTISRQRFRCCGCTSSIRGDGQHNIGSRRAIKTPRVQWDGVTPVVPLNIGESMHAPTPGTQLTAKDWPWGLPRMANSNGMANYIPAGIDSGTSIIPDTNGSEAPPIPSTQSIRDVTAASNQNTQDSGKAAVPVLGATNSGLAVDSQSSQAPSKPPVQAESSQVAIATECPSSTLFTVTPSSPRGASQGDLSVGCPPSISYCNFYKLSPYQCGGWRPDFIRQPISIRHTSRTA